MKRLIALLSISLLLTVSVSAIPAAAQPLADDVEKDILKEVEGALSETPALDLFSGTEDTMSGQNFEADADAAWTTQEVRYQFEHSVLPRYFYEVPENMLDILSDPGIYTLWEAYTTENGVDPTYAPDDYEAHWYMTADDTVIAQIDMPVPEETPLCYRVYFLYNEDAGLIGYYTTEYDDLFEGFCFICTWDADRNHALLTEAEILDKSDAGYASDLLAEARQVAMLAGVSDELTGEDMPETTPAPPETDSTDPEPGSEKPQYDEFQSGGFTAALLDDDTVMITGVAPHDGLCPEIPAALDAYPVSTLGEDAFAYEEFDDLTIPDTVRVIAPDAFAYVTVNNSVSLPENAEIQREAFRYAELPQDLTIPQGASVGEEAFAYLYGTENLQIADSVTIGSAAFAYAETLKTIVAGDSVEIGEEAFSYCDELVSAVIGDDAALAEDAFEYCPQLHTIDVSGQAEGDGKPDVPDTSGQNSDTLADWNLRIMVPDDTEAMLDGEDYYIYTEEIGSIPYILVHPYAYDSVDAFLPDFTEYMQSVYADLEVTAEPVEKTIGDKTCTEIDYSYHVSGYTVRDRRIVTTDNGRVYMFAAKEVPELDKLVGDLLEEVVENAVFLSEE